MKKPSGVQEFKKRKRADQITRQGVLGFVVSGFILGGCGVDFYGWGNFLALGVVWFLLTGWRMKKDGLV